MIDVNNLFHCYQEDLPVLENLNLQIPAGELVCVIGHSGCGKSTLIRLLAGLTMIQKGEILLGGKPIAGPGLDRAVVFQDYSLFPWMNVLKNVCFAVRQRGDLNEAQVRKRAEYFLRRAGLETALEKYPCQLSGGMKQRAAIARALALDAPILLLDEPFGALDTKIRRELQRFLKEISKREGKQKTIVFVTHDLEEAMILADRIIFIKEGRVAENLVLPAGINACCDQAQGRQDCQEIKTYLQRLYQ